ncbi:MAG: glycerophosphodiester phosphodiesterase family protein [Planctomycetota bacterium]
MAISRPLVIAHRGASGAAPENTLAALQHAVDIGAGAVEFDVRRTADGQIVLMHDGSVDRTTDGAGKVEDLTLDQIRALDAGTWKGKRFAGERVPALRDALELLKGRAMPVIEIKDEGIASEVVGQIMKMDMAANVTVICFNAETLRQVREFNARIRTSLLIGEKEAPPPNGLIRLVRDAKANHPDLQWGLATRDCVEAFHAGGMPVWVWTVNEREAMRRIVVLGVDGITTDQPATLLDVINAGGI